MKRPLIGITFAYALGIVVASEAPSPLRIVSFLLPLFLALLLSGFLVRAFLGPQRLSGLILSLFFLLGVILYSLHAHPPSPSHLAHLPEESLQAPVLLEGTICAPPERLPPEGDGASRLRLILDRIILFGERETQAREGRIRISLEEPEGRLRYGDRLRLPVQLRRIRGYLNPGAFCPTRYLRSQGIYLEGRVKGKEEVLHLGRWGASTLLGVLYDGRQRMLDRIQEAVAAPYHGLLQAITLGDRSLLDPALEEDFIRSGTYHILAISGLNVTMVAAALYLLLRLLRLPLRLRAGLTILWVSLYAILAGSSPSVVRAAVMSSLFLAALVIEREADLFNTLALSALLILLWNPDHLLEAGFQLTFGATWGILLLLQPIAEASARRPPRWLWNSLAVSLAATLATFPLLAHHFHRVSLIGILANLPIVPLSGLITGLGLIFSLLSLFLSTASHWLAPVLEILIGVMARIAHLFARLPGASLPIFSPSPLLILLYYGALVSAWQWRKGRWPKAPFFLCFVLLTSLVAGKFVQVHHRSDPRATFLDVGQGDCALLELPRGRAILIDGGGSRWGNFDVGEQVVRSYLLHRWVGRLDRVVISHPHPDHVKGLLPILREFPVEQVWMAGGPADPLLDEALRALLEAERIPIRRLEAGEVLEEPPLQVRILHPSQPYLRGSPRGEFSDENNGSLVLRIAFGEIHLLFPGDIEAEAERRILSRGFALASQVIKIPHHGGKTSSQMSFVRAVRPTYAIASAGPYNPFGHPAPEVVRRYEAAGARVLQTGRDGAVTFLTNGKSIRVTTERQERTSPSHPLLRWIGLDP